MQENEKKGNEEKARSDSPGMDLSVFQPRGKRRCVIQNESKKAKEEWWSDEDEDEEKHDVDNNGKADVTDDENGKNISLLLNRVVIGQLKIKKSKPCHINENGNSEFFLSVYKNTHHDN